MSLFLKNFSTHSEYETYINGSGAILPNVSICTTEGDVHYNPYVEPETRVVAKFNITDTSSPTKIASKTSGFSSIEIDGVEQPSVVSAYTFSTTGEHTVKYTLVNPTTIDYSTFYKCYSLTSMTIPNSVTSIGYGAFNECSGLTSIDIPNSVTLIGYSAFDRCRSLTSIVIPSGVTSIQEQTFLGCSSLTSCTIGSGVTSIGYSAFSGCSSLISCTIGSGVRNIGINAFDMCYSLTSIVIPSGVTSIGSCAFSTCSSLTSITCDAVTAPTIRSDTFLEVKTGGTLYVPQGSSGYDTWMGTGNYYLGKYNWTKVEQ